MTAEQLAMHTSFHKKNRSTIFNNVDLNKQQKQKTAQLTFSELEYVNWLTTDKVTCMRSH